MAETNLISCYCGSFDPITRGHLDVITRGARLCHTLIIGVGNNPHKKYLFSVKERLALVKAAIDDIGHPNTEIIIESYVGATVDFAEKYGATSILKGLRGAADYAYEEKMAIINHRLNTAIDTIFLFTDNELRDVSSSVAKEIARLGVDPEKLNHYLTPTVAKAVMKKFSGQKQAADDYDHA